MKPRVAVPVCMAIIILVPFTCVKYCEYKNYHYFIGEYKIDLGSTKLGEYAKDSALYEKLTLKIKKNYTFTMNMKVPFIFDSCGTWSAGAGLFGQDIVLYQEKSQLYFKNCTYLTELCDYFDTAIYLYHTPQQTGNGIQDIVFKRIGRR